MDLVLNICHSLFSIALIFVNLFVFRLNFQSLVFSFIILMPLLSQLISRRKKTNFLYPLAILKKPPIVTVVLAGIGIVPILFDYFSSRTFHVTVFLCNCIATPILVGTFIDYIRRINEKTQFIEIIYDNHHEDMIRITEIISQLVFFSVVLYNRMKFDEISHSIGGALNLIYQYIAMNLIVLTLAYLFFAVFKSDWKKVSYSEAYPTRPILAFSLFFVAWGSRAFLDTTNHIDLPFLISIIVYVIAVILVTTLLISSYYDYTFDSQKKKELNLQINKSIPLTLSSAFSMLLYCWLAYHYDTEKLSKAANNQPVSELLLYILIVACLVILFVSVIVILNLMRKKEHQ